MRPGAAEAIEPTVPGILQALERRGSEANREGMARYGIVSPRMFGVSVAELRRMAKRIGPDHPLALQLWDTGWYEARMLACFLADPQALTAAQMDRWVRTFDNWAITDTACFSLFDRTPHAWRKVDQWSLRKAEFVRRAGFALLASLALHDRDAPDAAFRSRVALIETQAADERNFVRKALSWALHAIGSRSRSLHAEAVKLAQKLAASEHSAERWVGKDAARKLSSAATRKRLERGSAAANEERRNQLRGSAGSNAAWPGKS